MHDKYTYDKARVITNHNAGDAILIQTQSSRMYDE